MAYDRGAPVSDSNPMPMSGAPYRGVVAIVVGTDQTPQRGVAISCTVAGTVELKMADDSTLTVTVPVGVTILPLAVKTVVAAGTTATVTCTNLK